MFDAFFSGNSNTHFHLLRVTVLSWAVVLGIVHCSFAQTEVILIPVKDNTLYESLDGSVSNGAGMEFFAGRTNSGELRRALLAFDVSAGISAGTAIDSVQLRLHVSRTSADARVVSIHRVLSDWGEGTSVATGNGGRGGAAANDDATWLHTFFSADMWLDAGGDFNPVAGADRVVDQVGFYTWFSTADLVSDVQNWLDSPGANFGWMLKGDESVDNTTKRFDSRENANPAFTPKLHIFHSTPTGVHTGEVPASFQLSQNFPNPFRGTTTVVFELEMSQSVSLSLIDNLGRVVRETTPEWFAAGIHHYSFSSEHLSPGIYVYRLQTETRSEGKTMVIL